MKIKWNTPKIGDKRIVTKFLLFPKWIGSEVRWLETVSISQHYFRAEGYDSSTTAWWSMEFLEE